MNSPCELELADVAVAAIDARLKHLEAFADQASGAIEQLVDAVLRVQEDRAAPAADASPAPPSAPAAAIDALHRKLRDLEQQLALDRATRDFAHVSRMHPKARIAVFVGTTYFGCNVKYVWLAAHERAHELDLQAWFLPFNEQQQQIVESLGGLCFPASPGAWTPEHLHAALSAAVVVTTDHFLNPNPYAPALLAGARQIQLWHVVSIKEIGLRNLPGGRALGPHLARVLATCGPYAAMVGTTAAAQQEWRRWFAFERYAATGYPRNDVLYREPTPADLAGCDRLAYDRAQATLARGKRVLLYAPTFRDGRPEWILQAGLEHLARAAAQHGDLLVVNLHPVESPQIPRLAPHLPGVVFVTPRTDLYPLLGRASALITDYSSIMFDYLHVDRPILLYRPDHEAYVSQSRKLFDDKLAQTPGPLFTEATSLARAIRREDLAQTDTFVQARANLRRQWFDDADGSSAQRVLQELEVELGAVAAAATRSPAPPPQAAREP